MSMSKKRMYLPQYGIYDKPLYGKVKYVETVASFVHEFMKHEIFFLSTYYKGG